jgi:hypothetical protein
MGDKACDERLASCTTRMDSQADDIKTIFATKASKSVLFWTLGIFFVLIIGSYGYTKTIADEVSQVVTQKDMAKYQEAIIKAIGEIK